MSELNGIRRLIIDRDSHCKSTMTGITMHNGMDRRVIVWLAAAAMILLGLYIRMPGFRMDTVYQDIYFTWVDGEKVARGVNPYERVSDSDMVVNDKYPTYLPPMYLIAAVMYWAGLQTFESFLAMWRVLILSAEMAVGFILVWYALKKGRGDVGLFALFCFLFCRWSLYVWEIGNAEAVIALLMIGAILTWEKRPIASALMFGLALSLKHFGILLLPVLLARSRDRRELIVRLCWVLAIPILTSLPFLITSPMGFIKAMLFNVTRGTSTHLLYDAKSIHGLFGASGLVSRIFLIGVFGLFWYVAIRGSWNLWLAATVAFIIFVSFNPVLFIQYFGWITPFGLLYLCDAVGTSSSDRASPIPVRES